MAEHVQVTLELELTDPISGRLLGADGEERDFSGWLQMLSALEMISADARESHGLDGEKPGVDDG
jgi:hypothetical protein